MRKKRHFPWREACGMSENRTGIIYGIDGPVVSIKGTTPFRMGEMVYVGNERLIGEVISLSS